MRNMKLTDISGAYRCDSHLSGYAVHVKSRHEFNVGKVSKIRVSIEINASDVEADLEARS